MWEICPYYYLLPIGAKVYFNLMNRDTWNSLPPDLQELALSLLEPHGIEYYLTYEVEGGQESKDELEANLLEINEPSAEDLAELDRVVSATVFQEWVDKMNKRGLPGQKILNKWIELNKYYQGQPYPTR